MSLLMFAGASQLAMADVLGSHGSAPVAVVTALDHQPAHAALLGVARPGAGPRTAPQATGGQLLPGRPGLRPVGRSAGTEPTTVARVPFYFGLGCTLGASWQTATLVGALVGSSVCPTSCRSTSPSRSSSSSCSCPCSSGGRPWSPPRSVAPPRSSPRRSVPARLAIVIGGVCGIVAGAVAEGRRDRGPDEEPAMTRRLADHPPRRRRDLTPCGPASWSSPTGSSTCSPMAQRILRQIPPAVLAALVVPALSAAGGNARLLAAPAARRRRRRHRVVADPQHRRHPRRRHGRARGDGAARVTSRRSAGVPTRQDGLGNRDRTARPRPSS